MNIRRTKIDIIKISLLALVAVAAPIVSGKSLCTSNEQIIFSFDTKNAKSLSICKGKLDEYLVYRYGSDSKIELQFPREIDSNSWKNFDFSGMSRAGGKANAGFGAYSLSFGIGISSYSVFQEWDDDEGTYNIGVTVNVGKNKPIKIVGLKQTQEGSLVLLEQETERLPNQAE